MNPILFSIICGLSSILYGFLASKSILASDSGNNKMREISQAIQEGANAYLKRQYLTISCVGFAIFLLIYYFFDFNVAFGFLLGAILSSSAGYVGMHISVRSNVRTAAAASKGLSKGLSIAFRAGSVTGMLVVGLALLSISSYYAFLLYKGINGRELIEPLIGLSFGASLISIFARLGGGIFTKGADVGADLVGKLEAGIPEDDPRNPAVIADNVGDNVGDCAGMAADLFETYVVTVVATMVLASIFFNQSDLLFKIMSYPLAIGGACIITSIIGTFFVKLGKSNNIMGALYKGFFVTAILSIISLWFLTDFFLGLDQEFLINDKNFNGIDLFYCGVTGLVITSLLIWVTEY